MKLKTLVTLILIFGISCFVNADEPDQNAVLDVSFTSGSEWDGVTIPQGQQCKMFEGNGSSPALTIENIPAGANAILVSFNDKTFRMNDNGGHGIIGMWVEDGQSSLDIPSVVGETNDLPEGMFIEAKFRSNRGTDGAYLPPCSGGRGNQYDATVKAVYKSDVEGEEIKLLGEGVISLGRY